MFRKWVMLNKVSAGLLKPATQPEVKTEETQKVEPSELICPKCGKEYKSQHWYDEHVEGCEG